MVSNYKILRKAGLEIELFVRDADEAALAQEEADRDWAREQEKDPLGDVMPAPAPPALIQSQPERNVIEASAPDVEVIDAPASEAEVIAAPAPEAVVQPPPAPQPMPAPPVTAEQSISSDSPSIPESPIAAESPIAEEPPPTQALVKVSGPRDWTGSLADITGNPSLEGIQSLGVCALESRHGASDATAALARWVAQDSGKPVLVVEGHFQDPRHAICFNVPNVGVSDALDRLEGLDDFIQETADDNVQVLAAGEDPGFFSRGKVLAQFPDLFAGLRGRFDTIIVELPAVDDPSLRKLPIASIADAVILVVDPKTVPPRKLKRASEDLVQQGARLAAVMLGATHTLSAALRRDRLAQQVQTPVG